MLDLVEGGSSWEEIVELAQAVEDAGATILNTGIGWHEARIPIFILFLGRVSPGLQKSSWGALTFRCAQATASILQKLLNLC